VLSAPIIVLLRHCGPVHRCWGHAFALQDLPARPGYDRLVRERCGARGYLGGRRATSGGLDRQLLRSGDARAGQVRFAIEFDCRVIPVGDEPQRGGRWAIIEDSPFVVTGRNLNLRLVSAWKSGRETVVLTVTSGRGWNRPLRDSDADRSVSMPRKRSHGDLQCQMRRPDEPTPRTSQQEGQPYRERHRARSSRPKRRDMAQAAAWGAPSKAQGIRTFGHTP